jgi:hypothetical protein
VSNRTHVRVPEHAGNALEGVNAAEELVDQGGVDALVAMVSLVEQQ